MGIGVIKMGAHSHEGGGGLLVDFGFQREPGMQMLEVIGVKAKLPQKL